MVTEPEDIRHAIFKSCEGKTFVAVLIAEAQGILSGVDRAKELAASLALEFEAQVKNGDPVSEGTTIARISGAAVQMARAEEVLIGALSKASGIATQANKAKAAAGASLRVVSGGWKKMPLEIKEQVRQAVRDGGLDSRIADQPFVYVDKNYVRMLGGIPEIMAAVSPLDRSVAVQVRGETAPIELEAVQAARLGAAVVMVDTGIVENLISVHAALLNAGLRERVTVAFAGNVSLNDLKDLRQEGADVVDIGYDILDARALPIRFDVVGVV